MPDNKRLVPTCIIYLDGVRMNTACEGAFRSVKVFDVMNKVSACIITFDYADLGKENEKIFSFNTEVSVHLGYKDDVQEVFYGELTGTKITYNEHSPARFTITASSFTQRLNIAIRNRVFENKTESQAIQDILSKYDLQADCESFGIKTPHWQAEPQTDFDLIIYLASRFGRDVCTFGKKVYVKQRMTHLTEEIIYEWGKSLIDFRTDESIEKQVSSVQVLGWNPLEAKGFSAKKTLDDLTQKVGGRTPWTKATKGGGKQYVHNMFDHGVNDAKEAGELALGKLRQMSFQFLRAEGIAEGNQKLTAGMEVTVKNVGKAFSGDYIAEAVIHDFSLDYGYTTEFRLKRNMMDDEFVKQLNKKASLGGYGQGATTTASSAAQSQTEESAKDEEDEGEEGPEFRGLVWKKDGKTTNEALVDDDVTMCFEVKNIDDGETVNVKIKEHDEDGEHDDIKDMTGEVKNGKVEIPWKVEYHADDDDSESSCAQEIEEYGYTVPEYFFIAEYNGVKSKEEPPNLLHVKGWVRRQLTDKKTGEIWANRKYTLILPDKTRIEGTTDDDGYVEPSSSPFGGEIAFFIHEEENAYGG